jgi:hypothetical protein
MRVVPRLGRPGPVVSAFGIVLAGTPFMALSTGLDTTDLLAACHAVMGYLAGSLSCGSRGRRHAVGVHGHAGRWQPE